MLFYLGSRDFFSGGAERRLFPSKPLPRPIWVGGNHTVATVIPKEGEEEEGGCGSHFGELRNLSGAAWENPRLIR